MVQIKKVENISAGGDLLGKVDPYVDLAVRDRRQRTRTIWNTKNPEFDEVFNLIVDDLNSQVLTIRLHDDMGFHDPVTPPPHHKTLSHPPPPSPQRVHKILNGDGLLRSPFTASIITSRGEVVDVRGNASMIKPGDGFTATPPLDVNQRYGT